jgi:protein TonB
VVTVRAVIGSDGQVRHAEVITSSGFILLDNAAVKSIAGWRFVPAREGEALIESTLDIPVRFILQGEG